MSIEQLYNVRETAFGGTIGDIRIVKRNYDLGIPIVNPIPDYPEEYFVEDGVHRILVERERGATNVYVYILPSLFRIPPLNELTRMDRVRIITERRKPTGFGIYEY